jgi:hypothetical protein
MTRSGADALRMLLVPALLLFAGCVYGFTGGGLPSGIRTVAVLPFENETQAAGLERDLQEVMRREVEGRLGLRPAGESNAHAIVRGRILRYEPDIPAAYSADPRAARTARRRLELAVQVELVDQVNGRTLWSNNNLVAVGEYSENAEGAGRRLAIEKIVSDLISGAQSQW